jgi:hypothetical protein
MELPAFLVRSSYKEFHSITSRFRFPTTTGSRWVGLSEAHLAAELGQAPETMPVARTISAIRRRRS